jgi:hypothetical protein
MQDVYQLCPCKSGKKYKFCCAKTKYVPAILTKDEYGNFVYRAPDLIHDVPALTGVDGKILGESLFKSAYFLIATFEEIAREGVSRLRPLSIAFNLFEQHQDLHLHLLQILLVMKAKNKPNQSQLNAGFSALGEALEKLRYSVEKDREWAQKLAVRFQDIVAETVLLELEDTETASHIASMLRDAKLPISASFTNAMAKVGKGKNRSEHVIPSTEELAATFEKIVKDSEINDPYELYETMMSALAGVDADYQLNAMAGLARSNNTLARDVASLCFLHENKRVREETAKFFLTGNTYQGLTPDGLRRLICIRNWLPEEERSTLDEVIKRSRKEGIECGQIAKPEIRELLASPFDGSGGQGIWGASRLGKADSLFGVLVRQDFGIRDAWVMLDASKSDIKNVIAQGVEGVGACPVSITYTKNLLSYFLWVANHFGNIPSINLLRVAEAMGETTWAASKSKFADELNELRGLATSDSQPEIIQRSGAWMGETFAQGWFEDSPAVDAIVAPHAKNLKHDPRKFDKLVLEVVDNVVKDRRDVWAERLEWMALFSKNASSKKMPKGNDFLVVADEIRSQSALSGIPLMLEIGRLSVVSAQKRAIIHQLT